MTKDDPIELPNCKDEILLLLATKARQGDVIAGYAILGIIDAEPEEEQARIYEMLMSNVG